MEIILSPEGSPSDQRSPNLTSPKNNYPSNVASSGVINAANYDVPFFTVAHYQSPVSPTTYEVPVRHYSSTNSLEKLRKDKLLETNISAHSNISTISPVEIAFGHLMVDNNDVAKDGSDSGTSCQSSAGSFSFEDHQTGTEHRKKKHDDKPVRGFSSTLFSPKPFQAKQVQNVVPHKVNFKGNTQTEKPIVSVSTKWSKSPEPIKESRDETDKCDQPYDIIENKSCTAKQTQYNTSDSIECKKTIYEDASVTLTGEKIDSQLSRPSSASSDQTPRTPKYKSREQSFCLEFDTEPQDEAEYLAVLHLRIAEAHERQLLPLKEDVADWMAKLLNISDITPDNLISRLDNGVILCQLSDLISKKAQQSKDAGISTLEVPKLPYRIWPRARSGSFFARDNITNFLRFCRRLGVHENLLFETEDLVCRTAVRGLVLCLLEVGRLATLWWGMEAPILVKLEKELAREDIIASRFDSDFATCCVRSNLCLPSEAINQIVRSNNERPMSAPVQFKVENKNNRNGKKFNPVPPISARGPKPTPPPKPASIKAALYSTATRPTNFPAQRTYERGWSGAQTTPVTPSVTPTYSSRTRLPVATTPRSSGRSTPNTTPATPTNSRKYFSSLKKVSSSKEKSGIPRLTNYQSTSKSSLCSKRHDSSPTETEITQLVQAELDNKVKSIAKGVRGVCNCVDVNCLKAHVRRLADGKYEIHGRNVLVRLLKGKHVMVRVGGGWDTLEHYLLRHSRNEVKKVKMKTYSHSPANYCPRVQSSQANKVVKTIVNPKIKTSNDDRLPSLITTNLINVSTVDEIETTDTAEMGQCCLISAPVGENGDFQATPLASSGKMVSSCPTLDIVDAEDIDIESSAQERSNIQDHED